MNNALLALFCAFAGATDVWTTPVSVPLEVGLAGKGADILDQGKVYAAQGEWEGFLLFVRAGRGGLEQLLPAGAPEDSVAEAPEIFVVDPADPLLADTLPRAAPRDLPQDETAVYWVGYRINADAKPGVHTSEIDVRSGGKRTKRLPVRIEVFDFALPARPALPAITPLNRDALRRTYGLRDEEVEAWRPHYAALAQTRVSFGLWDGGELVPVGRDGTPDPALFQQHLALLFEVSPPAVVDLGGNGRALEHLRWEGQPQDDPARGFFMGMAAWLARQDALARAQLEPMPLPPRAQWDEAQARFRRAREVDPFVPRLVVGAPHPLFERLAERWAIPFSAYMPGLGEQWRSGYSIAGAKAVEVSSIVASASGEEHPPADAYDGTALTHWASLVPPGRGITAWLELVFPAPRRVQTFTVTWPLGQEPLDLDVETAFPNGPLQKSSCSWEHRSGDGRFRHAVSRVELRYAKEIVRLRFSSSKFQEKPLGIAEVSLGAPDAPVALEERRPIAPWLHVVPEAFPRLDLSGAPLEARLVPWVCWMHQLDGFVADGMNDWPTDWRTHTVREALPPARGNGAGWLVVPGPDTPRLTLRARHLRDGLEEYDYLAALQQALRDGHISEDDAHALVPAAFFPPSPPPEAVAQWAAKAHEAKIAIGRALAKVARQRGRNE